MEKRLPFKMLTRLGPTLTLLFVACASASNVPLINCMLSPREGTVTRSGVTAGEVVKLGEGRTVSPNADGSLTVRHGESGSLKTIAINRVVLINPTSLITATLTNSTTAEGKFDIEAEGKCK